MKTKTIFLTVLLIAFLLGCQEDESVLINLNQPFTMQYGKSVELSDEQIKLTLTEIDDSRCAIGVVCVWEGMVEVSWDVVLKNKQVHQLTLNDHYNSIDTIENYIFELINVSPYPEIDKPLELDDYSVEVRIYEMPNE